MPREQSFYARSLNRSDWFQHHNPEEAPPKKKAKYRSNTGILEQFWNEVNESMQESSAKELIQGIREANKKLASLLKLAEQEELQFVREHLGEASKFASYALSAAQRDPWPREGVRSL